MYTEKDRDIKPRKRSFKFVNKRGQTLDRALSAKPEIKEVNEVEKEEFKWPHELMAIMNQVKPTGKSAKRGKSPNSKVKTFYSLNEKIKAYILATNFSPILESFVKNSDPRYAGSQPIVTDEAFLRAL